LPNSSFSRTRKYVRVFFFPLSSGAGGTFPLQPDISMSGTLKTEIVKFN
jgi:hypothetical protein